MQFRVTSSRSMLPQSRNNSQKTKHFKGNSYPASICILSSSVTWRVIRVNNLLRNLSRQLQISLQKRKTGARILWVHPRGRVVLRAMKEIAQSKTSHTWLAARVGLSFQTFTKWVLPRSQRKIRLTSLKWIYSKWIARKARLIQVGLFSIVLRAQRRVNSALRRLNKLTTLRMQFKYQIFAFKTERPIKRLDKK